MSENAVLWNKLSTIVVVGGQVEHLAKGLIAAANGAAAKFGAL
jgi:hypothetical protein